MGNAHPHNYTIIRVNEANINVALSLLDTWGPDNFYGLDIETAKHPDHKLNPKAGLDPHLSRVRLVQISSAEVAETLVFDLFELTEESIEILLNWIRGREFFAHFAQFEAVHFQKLGIKNLKVHCTQVLYRMWVRCRHPKPTDYSATLQSVCKVMLKVDVAKTEQTSDWGAPELSDEQIIYAARDAAYTLVIGKTLLPRIQKLMPRAYSIYNLSIAPIARMMLNGIYFNRKAHKDLLKDWEELHRDFERKLKKQFGEMNFNSGKQLNNLLHDNFPKKLLSSWPKTPKGKLKTDLSTLSAFKSYPGISELSEYKKYQKLISTYGKGLVAAVNPVTRRIHCAFSLGYTATGRLSSFNPNLQNLPRGGDVRSKFKNQFKTTRLVGADFSQIEIKVAALVSKDPVMLEVFRTGGDIYSTTASLVLGKPISKVKKGERQIGKSLALGLLFGMGARAYCEYANVNFDGVDVSLDEAEHLVNRFHEAFPVYREWQLEQANQCSDSLVSRTRSGMIRKLSEDNYFTCGMNTPIQGSAAEIILASLIRIDRVIIKKELKARLINCIHDEILIECRTEIAERMAKLLKRCMVKGFKDVFPDTMGITDFVDVKIGKTWSDLK